MSVAQYLCVVIDLMQSVKLFIHKRIPVRFTEKCYRIIDVVERFALKYDVIYFEFNVSNLLLHI